MKTTKKNIDLNSVPNLSPEEQKKLIAKLMARNKTLLDQRSEALRLLNRSRLVLLEADGYLTRPGAAPANFIGSDSILHGKMKTVWQEILNWMAKDPELGTLGEDVIYAEK